MPLVCRLLPYSVATGPLNMAADEVLLEAAQAGVASIRFYGWSAPTLSLGYFQAEVLRHGDESLAALPYVRRPTGGMTLVHHHELTYAMAIPAGQPWQTRKLEATSWLCRIHAVIADALRELQVNVQAASCASEASSSEPTQALCFRHVTPGDLLIDQTKVAGSAQRQRRDGLLQHGGILLAASPHAPILPGIAELCGVRLALVDLCTSLEQAWQRLLGWDLVSSEWTFAEQERLATLVLEKYSQPAWNQKR